MNTTALPYIFRSLEKAKGRDGYDTVTLAAVAAYAAIRHPTELQKNALVSLLEANWPRLAPSTRRAIKQALCAASCIPTCLVQLLRQDDASKTLAPAAASIIGRVRKTQLAHRHGLEQTPLKPDTSVQSAKHKPALLRNFGLLRQRAAEGLIAS